MAPRTVLRVAIFALLTTLTASQLVLDDDQSASQGNRPGLSIASLRSQGASGNARTSPEDIKDCPVPLAPLHGQVECLTVHITASRSQLLCTFTCDDGFSFKGVSESSISKFCENGTFGFDDIASFPACVSVCEDPELPPLVSLSCSEPGIDALNCTASCQSLHKFESAPAGNYVCTRDGGWLPALTTMPKCVRDQGTILSPGHAVCAVWGEEHYQTFDKNVYSFKGKCRYVLAYEPNTFTILVVNSDSCLSGESCKRSVEIYFGDHAIALKSTLNGSVVLWNNKNFPVPGSRAGTVIEKVGNYITVRSSLKFSIRWDGKQSVFIKVADDLSGQVHGLCGKFNGNPSDDFENEKGQVVTSVSSFGTSWKKTELSDASTCPDVPQSLGCLTDTQEKSNIAQQAELKCGAMLTDSVFKPCHVVIDPQPYIDACQRDCCEQLDGECTCGSMEAYSRACLEHHIKMDWRHSGRCEVQCPTGMVYKECGSSCIPDCTNTDAACSDPTCVDGCFCPAGSVLHNGQCIASQQCPCLHNGKEYHHGDVITEECSTCFCTIGKWNCTHKSCDAKCYVTGDPHYLTFDGRKYDFMGFCSYYLVKGNDFSIAVDNYRCGNGDATCTKSLSFNINGLSVRLDHNNHLIVNNYEVPQLPYKRPEVQVTRVSSLFVQAVLSNGISIQWDGSSRAYITAPPSMKGRVSGLCGNYDDRQTNDFLTPQGSLETNANIFGNQWKTEKDCEDVPTLLQADPCDTQSQRKVLAAELCGQLTGTLFEDCHDVEEVKPFYDACLYDLCSCTENLQNCLCPSLGTYADICAAKGIKINWRPQVKECIQSCPGGQEYQVCGKPCEYTCLDLAENTDMLCDQKCVEGCMCPEGQSLNDDGECVPMEECPCMFDGNEYPAGFTTLKGTEICVCSGAQWQCSRISFYSGNFTKVQPLCPENMEYTPCSSSCPLTCDNHASPPTCETNLDCEEACVCKDGYVYDGDKCVLPAMCPCYHSGHPFYEGDTFYMDCNECVCKSQRWECETKDCPSTCSAYGDSHYSTFDGRRFEFHGSCDYVLAQSIAENPDKFVITTTNLQCGTSGVACSKGIELMLGEEGTLSFYRLQLVRGKPVEPDPGSPFDVQEVGEMIYVSTPIGVTIQWDQGTRVYIRLAIQHIGNVEGLCGNFNGDQKDDFRMRSGGLPVVKATTFGDSWRVHSFCETSKEVVDTCAQAPERKAWAQHRCSVLGSELFQPCHALVEPKEFIERCEFDACGCDMGGDCECLCTAIAAYAQECADNGMPIKWRSKDLCGLPCEDCKEYNPCISVCPKKTCENRLLFEQISQDCEEGEHLCFEGCDFHPCPSGQVYDSLVEPVSCIPEPLCGTTACDINGKKYREGERIDDPLVCRQECEICICRGGDLEHISLGHCEPVTFIVIPPVTSISATPTPSTTGPTVSCEASGWTSWMSASIPTHINVGDRETVDGLRRKYTFCHEYQITDIHCRVISQQEYGVYFGQQVTCEVDTGLTCYHKDQAGGMCMDYEVSYYCDCTLPPPTKIRQGQETTITPYTPTPFSTVTSSTSAATTTSTAYTSPSSPTPSTTSSGTPSTPTHSTTSTPTPSTTSTGTLSTGMSSTTTSATPTPNTGTRGIEYTTTPGTSMTSTATPGTSTGTPGTSTTSTETAGTSTASTGTPSTSTGTPSISTSTASTGIPSTSTASTGTPSTSTASTGTPSSSTASTGTPGTSTTSTETAGTSTASIGSPGTSTASTGTPGTSTVSTGTSSTSTASTATASTGTPSTSTAGTGTPSTSTAGTGTPGTSTTSTETAGTSTASTGSPGTSTASTGTPGTSTASTGTPSTSTGTSSTNTGFPSTSTASTGTPSTRTPSSTSASTSSIHTVVPTTSSTPGIPRQPFPSCEWTNWMSSSTPTSFGETESISNLRLAFGFCEYPTDIKCRTVPDDNNVFGISYDQAGQMGVTCDLNRGLVCLNSAQVGNQTCYDYEVAVLCMDGCPSTGQSTHVTPTTGSSAKPPSTGVDQYGNPTPPIPPRSSQTPVSESTTFSSKGTTYHEKPTTTLPVRTTSYPSTASQTYTFSTPSSTTYHEVSKYSPSTYKTRSTEVTPSTSRASTTVRTESTSSTHPTSQYTTTQGPPATTVTQKTETSFTRSQTSTESTVTTNPPITSRNKVCDELMGLFSKQVTGNDLFDASSSLDAAFDAHNGRLNNKPDGPANGGAWKPRLSDQEPYLIIDLEHVENITGIITQGRPDAPEWVTQYKVHISTDGIKFSPYMEKGTNKVHVFKGNSDSNSAVMAFFDKPISMKKIAIYPLGFVHAIAMRVDLLSCDGIATVGLPPTPTTSTTQNTASSTPSTGTPGTTSTGTSSPGTPSTTPTGTPSTGTPSTTFTGTSSSGTPSTTPSAPPNTGTRIMSTTTPGTSTASTTSTGTSSTGTSGTTSTGTLSTGTPSTTSTGTSSSGTPSTTPSAPPNTGTRIISTITPGTSTASTTSTGTSSTGTPGTTSTGTSSSGTPSTTPTGTPSTGTPSTTFTGTSSSGTPSTTPSAPPNTGTRIMSTTTPGTSRASTTFTGTSSTGTPGTTSTGLSSTVTPGTTYTGTLSTGTPGTTSTGTSSSGTPSTTPTGLSSTVTPGTTYTGTSSTGTPGTTSTGTSSSGTPSTTPTGTPSTGTPSTTSTGTSSSGTPSTTPSAPPNTGTRIMSTTTPGTSTPSTTYTGTSSTGTPGTTSTGSTGTPSTTYTGTYSTGTPGTISTGTPGTISTGTSSSGTSSTISTTPPNTGTRILSTATPGTSTASTTTPAIPSSPVPSTTSTGTFSTGTPSTTSTGTSSTSTPSTTSTSTPSTGTPSTTYTGTSTPSTTSISTPSTGTPSTSTGSGTFSTSTGTSSSGTPSTTSTAPPNTGTRIIPTASPGITTSTISAGTSTSPIITFKVATPSPPMTRFPTSTTATTVSGMTSYPTEPTVSQYQCVKSHWLPRINRHSDIAKDGDRESLSPEELAALCYDGNVTDIKCYTQDGRPSDQTGEIVHCDLANGLICSNSENGHVCQDYSIAYWCECFHFTEQPTATSYPTQPSETGVTESTQSPTTTGPRGKDLITQETTTGTASTASSAQTPTRMTTISPPTSMPTCISSWSEWINKSTPSEEHGEHEMMTAEEMAQLCPGGDITDILCEDINGMQASNDPQSTCTVQNGLTCASGEPVPGSDLPLCNDYKIRYYCKCGELLPTPTTKPQAVKIRCGWSPWLNADKPMTTSVDNGDMETIELLKSTYGVCPNMVDINCRVAGTSTSSTAGGQTGVQCDRYNGLRCFNKDTQNGECYDYEVSVLCWDDTCPGPTLPPLTTTTELTTTALGTGPLIRTTVACLSGKEWNPCAYTCDEVCHAMGRAAGACSQQLTGDCIPGCKTVSPNINSSCPAGQKRLNQNMCVEPAACTCLKPDGTVAKPLESWTNPDSTCSRCSCFNNEVVCTSALDCSTPEPTPVTTPPETPLCGWSTWVNMDKPSTGTGDVEHLSAMYGMFGIYTTPLAIECRDASSKKDVKLSGQKVTCDKAEGLKCLNAENDGGCKDYEIRVFSPCTSSSSPVTEETTWYSQSTVSSQSTVTASVPSKPTKSMFTTSSPATSSSLSSVTSRPTGSSTVSPVSTVTSPSPSSVPTETSSFPSTPTTSKTSVYTTGSSSTSSSATPLTVSTSSVGTSSSASTPTTSILPPETTSGPSKPTKSLPFTNGTSSPFTTSIHSSEVPTGTPTSLSYPPETSSVPSSPFTTGTSVYTTSSPWTVSSRSSETSHGTSRPTSSSTTPETTSAPSTKIPKVLNKCGWTEWMNDGVKNPQGDMQTILYLRGQYTFCEDSAIIAIKCRDTVTKKPADELGQKKVKCDLSVGLVCFNSDQPDGQCAEYEVSFLCDPIGADCVNLTSTTQTFETTTTKTVETTQSSETAVTHSTKLFSTPEGSTKVSTTGGTETTTASSTATKTYATTPTTTAMKTSITTEQHYSTPLLKVCEYPMTEGNPVPVLDSSLSASSSLSPYAGPDRSRLDTPQDALYSGGWVAKYNSKQEWIQVKFPQAVMITGITTQGRQGASDWVKSYRVFYSSDGITFHNLLTRDEESPYFSGNSDSNTKHTEKVKPTEAIFVKIQPQEWNSRIAMRFEILGCRPLILTTVLELNTTISPTTATTKSTASTSIPTVVTSFSTVLTTTIPEVCQKEMGLRDMRVRNDMLTASSYRDLAHIPGYARLGETRSWMPAISDSSPYIQVDFMEPQLLSGVTTQGRADVPLYVQTYKVFYSNDGITWIPYRETGGMDKIFKGNWDSTTPVTNLFRSPVRAQYIRILPQTWHDGIALRFEIQGCSNDTSYPTYPTTKSTAATTPTAPTTAPTFSTGTPRIPPVTASPTPDCIEWDQWLDLNQPSLDNVDDVEPIADLIASSLHCHNPLAIDCRPVTISQYQAKTTAMQKVSCNLWEGLACHASDTEDPICVNYKARLGCAKETPECMGTPPPPVPTCYPGLDTHHCPDTCPNGLLCNGTTCVHKADCPCTMNGRIVRPDGVDRNENCEICQCLNGEILCMPPTQCPPCQQGISTQNTSSCSCQCLRCETNEFQCGDASCISAQRRCDGVIDCVDDELNCGVITPFIPPVSTQQTTKGTTARPTTVTTGATTLTPPRSFEPSSTITATAGLTTTATKSTTVGPSTTTGYLNISTEYSTTAGCAGVVCPTPQTPPMREGMTAKLQRTQDGCCQEYVVCDPDTCPGAAIDCSYPMVSRTVTSKDCCPTYECVCPVNCPEAPMPKCAPGSDLVETMQDCNCTTYTCREMSIVTVPPPPQKCSYLPAFDDEAGMFSTLLPARYMTFEIGESWTDGPCTSCKCTSSTDDAAKVLCTEHECAPCKLGEKEVLKPGTCCATCEQYGCVVGDQVYKNGETFASNRACYTASCQYNSWDKWFFVQETQVPCEKMENLPPCQEGMNETDASGCCPSCKEVPPGRNRTFEICEPSLVFGNSSETESIGYFKITPTTGVECVNDKPILDLKQCDGFCGSKSIYSKLMQGFDSDCKCCQPSTTVSKPVELLCTDGQRITRNYDVVETCDCFACTAEIGKN